MWRRTLASMLLPRLAAGNVPAWLARPLHEAVRADLELGRKYDALRRMEQGASATAGERGLSTAQVDLLEDMLFGGASPPALAPEASRRRFALPGLAFGGGAALAATAVIAFVVVSPGQKPSGDDSPFSVGDLSARSARLASEPLGMKISCVEEFLGGHVVDTATGGARQGRDLLTCTPRGLLAFSTTNLGSEPRHMFVIGIGANGDRRWYAPFDKGSGSLVVPPGQVDELLPTLADPSTLPGKTSLHVLISDQPFDAASLERQLAGAVSRGVPLQTLEKLPLADVPLQARIDLMPEHW